jgi:hypothetical protein
MYQDRRLVYGPVTEQGALRIRTNQELRELHGTIVLLPGIKWRNLERLGPCEWSGSNKKR